MPINMEKYTDLTLYYGKDSPFSQFHPAKFVHDDVEYSCAQQFMMYQKALLFKDESMAEKIIKATNPQHMKRFGRKVKNFDKDVWKAKCQEIVKLGNLAKFSQNDNLREALLKTAGTRLAEASSFDHLWGIGLKASDPRALVATTWRGKNWLGDILTEIREELMEEER